MAKTRLRRGKTRQNRRTRRQRGGWPKCLTPSCMTMAPPVNQPTVMVHNPLAGPMPGGVNFKDPQPTQQNNTPAELPGDVVLPENLNQIVKEIVRERRDIRTNGIKTRIKQLNEHIEALYKANNRGNVNKRNSSIDLIKNDLKLLNIFYRTSRPFSSQTNATAGKLAFDLKERLLTNPIIKDILSKPFSVNKNGKVNWPNSLYSLRIIEAITNNIEANAAGGV